MKPDRDLTDYESAVQSAIEERAHAEMTSAADKFREWLDESCDERTLAAFVSCAIVASSSHCTPEQRDAAATIRSMLVADYIAFRIEDAQQGEEWTDLAAEMADADADEAAIENRD